MNERMKWSEAEAVVRAFRAAHGADADVDVETLARALGTNADEVRRLAKPRPRFTDRSGVLSAVLAFGIVTMAAFVVGPRILSRSPRFARVQAPISNSVRIGESPLDSKLEHGIERATAEFDAFYPERPVRVRIVQTL